MAKGKHHIVSLLPKQVLIFRLSGLVISNLNLVQVKRWLFLLLFLLGISNGSEKKCLEGLTYW